MRTRRFFYNATAVFLGLIFFTSGMGKLYRDHLFPGLIGPVWLADRLAEYGLKFFAEFIAAAQVLVGFAVLTPRFRVLGAVMLVPMVVNILMVTVSLQWRGTPYVLSFLLLLNLGLLWHDRAWFRHFLSGKAPALAEPVPPRTWKGHLAWLGGLGLVFGGTGLSFSVLWLSYVLVAGGIVLAWMSRRFDASRSPIA